MEPEVGLAPIIEDQARHRIAIAVGKHINLQLNPCRRHWLYNIITTPQHRGWKHVKNGLEAESPLQYALCATIDEGDLGLVARLVNNGADMWIVSFVFGSPLLVAFRTKSAEIIDAVLNYANAKRHDTPQTQRDVVLEIVDKFNPCNPIVEESDLNLRKTILRFALDEAEHSHLATRMALCTWAIQTKDIQSVQRMLQLAPEWSKDRLRRAYIAFRPTPKVLRTLVELNVLDVKKKYTLGKYGITSVRRYRYDPIHIQVGLHRGYCSDQVTSVLDHALLNGSPSSVREALKLRAPRDGVCVLYPLTWNLPVTKTRKWRQIRKVLLEYGSDPDSTYPRRSARIRAQNRS
ncbi:hypothetical protein M011DRAFT_473778 [Sporormia fimetaria CBS 119925]|uniref:Ankyrin n=1 Tax=Sporormia fimetaria CBS 119925 TaxID=1340428 RepID=A0A6A6VN75_9PLEO|nr:hypothetical protein M011DRAFT_473778 [Sporormia fimetaria CBS 119925]